MDSRLRGNDVTCVSVSLRKYFAKVSAVYNLRVTHAIRETPYSPDRKMMNACLKTPIFVFRKAFLSTIKNCPNSITRFGQFLAINKLHVYFFSHFFVLGDFVKVHVTINLIALLVDDTDIGLVFFNSRDFAQF